MKKDINKVALASMAQFVPYWIFSIILNKYSELNADLVQILSVIFLYGIGTVTFYLIIKSLDKVEIKKESLNTKTYLAAFSFQLFLQAIFIIALIIKNLIFPSEVSSDINKSLVNFISIILIAPIMGELVYRKFIGDRLIDKGKEVFILVSAFCFALPHLVSLGPIFVLSTFFLEITYGYLYLRTGRLIIAIIYHIIYNFMNGFMVLFILDRFGLIAVAFYVLILIILGIIGLIYLVKNKNEFNPFSKVKEPSRAVLSSKGILVFVTISVIFYLIKNSI